MGVFDALKAAFGRSSDLSRCLEEMAKRSAGSKKFGDEVAGLILLGIKDRSPELQHEAIQKLFVKEDAIARVLGDARVGSYDYCILCVTRNFITALYKKGRNPYGASLAAITRFLVEHASWMPFHTLMKEVRSMYHESSILSATGQASPTMLPNPAKSDSFEGGHLNEISRGLMRKYDISTSDNKSFSRHGFVFGSLKGALKFAGATTSEIESVEKSVG